MEKGGRNGGAAADVWAAAGMGHARAAALHRCAALDACLHSWAARVDGSGALGDAADARGRIVGGEGNTVSRSAIAATGAAMQRGVDALDRAAVEFGLAARLSGMAADGWDMAEKAFARAGYDKWERTARERSGEGRKMARTLGAWAERSRSTAGTLGQSAGEWVAGTADWPDGAVMEGGRGRWTDRQGELQAAARRERGHAEEMVRQTHAAARVAAGDLERIILEAGRRTDALGWVASAADRAESADLREAAAALGEGMEAARQAEKGR